LNDVRRIILDTNVVAETLRVQPNLAVIGWIDGQPTENVFTTTVTEAEIRYGIAILPTGRRRDSLLCAAEDVFRGFFADRVLTFDRLAAATYAEIAATRRAQGRPITTADCQIAAIAYVHGAVVATRNEADFRATGITVINPWTQTVGE
jgi:hypothetical protein